MASSSPGWVLAAKKTGRLPRLRLKSSIALSSIGGGGASYFKLPVMEALRAPSPVSRLAIRQFWVNTRSKRENTGSLRLGNRAHRLQDLCDILALTRTKGTLPLVASTIRFGQISDSVNRPRSGRQYSINRRQKRGLSSGMN